MIDPMVVAVIRSVAIALAMAVALVAFVAAVTCLLIICGRVASLRRRQKRERADELLRSSLQIDYGPGCVQQQQEPRKRRRSHLRLGHVAALERLTDDEMAELKDKAGSILNQLADVGKMFCQGRDPEAILGLELVLSNIRRRLGAGKHWLEAIVLRDLARQAHFENRIADRDAYFAQAMRIAAAWKPYHPWIEPMCSPRVLIHGLPKQDK